MPLRPTVRTVLHIYRPVSCTLDRQPAYVHLAELERTSKTSANGQPRQRAALRRWLCIHCAWGVRSSRLVPALTGGCRTTSRPPRRLSGLQLLAIPPPARAICHVTVCMLCKIGICGAWRAHCRARVPPTVRCSTWPAPRRCRVTGLHRVPHHPRAVCRRAHHPIERHCSDSRDKGAFL